MPVVSKRRRCSVRFALEPITVAPSPNPLSETEIAQSWWSKGESTEFKSRAKYETKRYIRENRAKIGQNVIAPFHQCSADGIGYPNDDPPCYRGLEHRACLERLKDRLVVSRAVLEVQARLKEGRFHTGRDPIIVLSLISQKLSKRAHETAHQTGESDAIQAFLAHKSITPSALAVMVAKGPPKQPRKRKADFLDAPCQRDSRSCCVDQRRERMRQEIRVTAC